MFWSQHLGCWGQNTSRIQNKGVHATLCLQAVKKLAVCAKEIQQFEIATIGLRTLTAVAKQKASEQVEADAVDVAG